MIETDLPTSIQYLLITMQIFAAGLFIIFVWPHIRKERWREKFIENKTARSVIIVLTFIFVFLYGIGAIFDTLFPIEELT